MTAKPLIELEARQRYSFWLLESLRQLYGQLERDEPAWMEYGDVRLFFGGDQSELIARMYSRAVPKSQRLAFRVAIGDALLAAVNDPVLPSEAMVDLLHSIDRIGAVEALHALPTLVVATKWPLVVVPRDNSTILLHVMTVLGSLVPGYPVANVTKQILDDRSFDESLLLWGLVLLAQCDPTDAAATMVRYADRVSALWNCAVARGEGQVRIFRAALEEWATETLEVVGESWIDEAVALGNDRPECASWLSLAMKDPLQLEPEIDVVDPSSGYVLTGVFKDAPLRLLSENLYRVMSIAQIIQGGVVGGIGPLVSLANCGTPGGVASYEMFIRAYFTEAA